MKRFGNTYIALIIILLFAILVALVIIGVNEKNKYSKEMDLPQTNRFEWEEESGIIRPGRLIIYESKYGILKDMKTGIRYLVLQGYRTSGITKLEEPDNGELE